MRAINILKTLAFAAAAGFAFDCAADVFVRDDIITDPDPAHFNICYDGGCASLATLKFSDEQGQRVRAVFAQSAASPAAEREQIRTTIGLFERIVGAMTGTANDKGGTFEGLSANPPRWTASTSRSIPRSI